MTTHHSSRLALAGLLGLGCLLGLAGPAHARGFISGGAIARVHPHWGIRGDLRDFHAFQDLEVLGFTVDNPKLDCARASAALLLTF